MAAIDEFLKLQMIQKLELSFSNARELRSRAEMLPSGLSWKCQTITLIHPTKSLIHLFWRDPVECLESLFSNPLFHDKLDFIPRQVYTMAAWLLRVYSEWLTGNSAWDMQSQFPRGATILGTMLSSDKTNITTMTGARIAHPLLLSLTNIHMRTCTKLSSKAFMLTALLPIPKYLHPNQWMHGMLEEHLIHECLLIVLKPLMIVAEVGIMMSDPVGNVRHCFAPLAAYIVDTPEAAMLTCVCGKTSPFTMASYLQFGDHFRHPACTCAITLAQLASITVDPDDLEAYFEACAEHQLNGVHAPFWQGFLHADPSIFLMPEPLHHWHKEFYDHDLQWCLKVVGAWEVDFRFSILQPITGYCHFAGGISKLKKVTGRVHQDIQHYIIGLISSVAPCHFVTVIRALMDVQYLAQCPAPNDDLLSSINRYLLTFHEHKDIIMTLGARMGGKKPIDNWFIPKLELLQSITSSMRKVGALIQWSADVTEHVHVSEIKDPARRTNNNDYDPQICRHLDREEKLRCFAIATTLKSHPESHDLCYDAPEEEERELDNTDYDEREPLDPWTALLEEMNHTCITTNYFSKAKKLATLGHKERLYPPRTFIGSTTAIHLNYNLSRSGVKLEDISIDYNIPDLHGMLSNFLQCDARD